MQTIGKGKRARLPVIKPASTGMLALIRSVKVLQGEPSQVILDQSLKLAVDLLVLGSHCQPAGAITHLGRTAARVIELAQMPVYMVPLLHRRRRSDG